MLKNIVSIIIIIVLFSLTAGSVSAGVPVAESSAELRGDNLPDNDYRVDRLRAYLNSHNSPLADHADVLIEKADEYRLDWRFVPAITGVESTFGKRIPPGSFNAYGWANGAYRFESWDDSIEIVSKTLREKYIDRGAVTINQIARRYAPPSPAWGGKVIFFINKIDPLPLEFDLEV